MEHETVVFGHCCEATFVVRRFELSKTSYPFDWAVVFSVPKLCEVLLTDFEAYERGMTVYEMPFYGLKERGIPDTQIFYPHFRGDMDRIKTKINRFRDLLKTNKKVLFLWKSHPNTNMSPEDAMLLVNTLHKISSSISFTLLIVNENGPEGNYPKECIVENIVGNFVPYDRRIPYSGAIHRCNPDKAAYDTWERILESLRPVK